MTATQTTHSAHGAIIELGGVAHSVRGTFALARAMEERFGVFFAERRNGDGNLVFDVARHVIEQRASNEMLADLLALMLPRVTRGEIEAHFDDVGIAGVMTEISAILAGMLRGFRALSVETEAALAENPQHPGTGERRRGPGRPAGARTKPKEPYACPGATLSAEPPVSEFAPSNSGALPHLNSSASGEPLALQQAESGSPELAAPQMLRLFSAPCQGTE